MSDLSDKFVTITKTPADPTMPSDQVKHLADDARSVQNLLGKSGFQLFPTPTRLTPLRRIISPAHSCAAALLSLGAPFWFNALKTLCSLRPSPAVAKISDK